MVNTRKKITYRDRCTKELISLLPVDKIPSEEQARTIAMAQVDKEQRLIMEIRGLIPGTYNNQKLIEFVDKKLEEYNS